MKGAPCDQTWSMVCCWNDRFLGVSMADGLSWPWPLTLGSLWSHFMLPSLSISNMKFYCYYTTKLLGGILVSLRPSVRLSVRHTCASALSGWVLYRQLELTKLTRPDLHHVVGLFTLKDVHQSLEYPCALRVPRTSPHGFLSSLVIQSLWICCLRMMGISVK